MALEEEMKAEVRKLENEISLLDQELEKLHGRILQIIALRRKKEKDLKALRTTFEPSPPTDSQSSLARLLKEIKEYKA
jgi:chromosome segregation ATPase